MFKAVIVSLLERRARRLLARYKPRIIAITGSVGKTSTKIFTGTVLRQHFRVLVHEGNYNTEVGLPLALFDMDAPAETKNPLAWLRVLREMSRQLRRPFEYDVIIVELGTDRPGDIARFRRYLHPDIALVTAVAPEHMASFKNLEAVAKEELEVVEFSSFSLLSGDDIDGKYMQKMPAAHTQYYGLAAQAQYRYEIDSFEPVQGFSGSFISPEYGKIPVGLTLLGEHNIRSAVAAGAVGIKLGLNQDEIIAGLRAIRPVAGRMQLLRGLRDSLLIDDTYNSSPKAIVAALQTLYNFATEQRIAILGSMNELGEHSETEHKQAGLACDPAKLEWVITIGADAEQYLAPAARSRGCQVMSFADPIDAGAFAHRVLRQGAVVLVKGSQNRIFSEEALKILLHDTEDEHRLVRQSPVWMQRKQAQFDRIGQKTAEIVASSTPLS